MSRDEYLVGVYGMLQLAMQDVDLLDKHGRPYTKKRKSPTETDALFLYWWVGEEIRDVSTGELRRMAKVTDNNVAKLLNKHTVVNNFLLGVMMLRLLVDDSGKYEQTLLGGKINRVIDMADKAVSEDEFSPQIKRETARTSDNLYRIYTERPQLSDEVRDAKFKRIKRELD